MRRRAAPGLVVALLAGALAVTSACGRDAAEDAYFAALAREKTGAPASELLPLISRAIALAPERASYWEKRGGYRAALGQLAVSESDFDRAIALADRPYLRYSRGLVRCRAGRCADAIADLDLAIAAQPENAQFYRARALARAQAGDASGALVDAEWLVARTPQDAEAFYARGVALAALGRHGEALLDYDEVLRRRPELVYPYVARAASYAALGRADEATSDRALAQAKAAERLRPDEGCGFCFDPLHF